MKDDLTSLRRQKRKVETRVTNSNKQSIINQINKYNKQFDDYIKISSKASVQEVERMKKQYKESLTRDIVEVAILKGNDIVAEIEGRDLKHSDDRETKRIGEFGKALAKAKKQSDSKLSAEEKEFLERGNISIKGYGNEDILKLFKNTKTKGQAVALIEQIKTQDPKKIFYDKEVDVFERTFQMIELTREDDLNKLKEKLKSLEMKELLNQTNNMIKTIEEFDYEKFSKTNVDETEIANARLDDNLIKLGLKSSASKKEVKVIFDKYKKKQIVDDGTIKPDSNYYIGWNKDSNKNK